jgi:Tfp pilus assembly protein PilO
MSYALRNSLILALLLVVVALLGAYWVEVRRAGQIKKLEARQAKLKKELEEVNAVLAVYDSTLAKLNHLQQRWQQRQYLVPAADTPAQTLAYLHEISSAPGAGVSFDFLYKGRVDQAGYSANAYALEGEGAFADFYGFLHRLERGRRFQAIDQLHLSQVEAEGQDPATRGGRMKFKMILRTYFSPGSPVEEPAMAQERNWPEPAVANPFQPLIASSLPGNHLGLFEVEGARLQGLAGNLAYLLDRRGRSHLLRKGDRVYLGRLDRIDVGAKLVEFLLDKGGIWERQTLKMESGSSRP